MLVELGALWQASTREDKHGAGTPETPVIQSALAWPTLHPFPIPQVYITTIDGMPPRDRPQALQLPQVDPNPLYSAGGDTL